MVTINSCDFGTGTSGQVLTSNGSGVAPTFQSLSLTSSWTDSSGTFTATANTNYFLSAATTVTLPAAPSQGNFISIICDTASAVVITANAGQKIRLGTSLSVTAGTCSNTNQGDSIQLIYRAADTTWITFNSPTGGWTVT